MKKQSSAPLPTSPLSFHPLWTCLNIHGRSQQPASKRCGWVTPRRSAMEQALLSLTWRAGFSLPFSRSQISTRIKTKQHILCSNPAIVPFDLGVHHNPHLCPSKQRVCFYFGRQKRLSAIERRRTHKCKGAWVRVHTHRHYQETLT